MPSLPSENICASFLFNIFTKLHYEVLWWFFYQLRLYISWDLKILTLLRCITQHFLCN